MEHPIDLEATGNSVPRAKALASAIQRGSVVRDTAFLNNIIDAVADPILVKDSRLRFVLVNQALCDFTGIPRERFIGRTDEDLFPMEQAAVFNAMDRKVFATGQPNVNEEAHTHADGSVRTIRTTKTCFTDENGKQVLVGIFTDLTALRATQRELEAANQRLHDLAHLDRLTGLPNRMYFEETLAREAAAAARQHESFAVLFMDLNGFKHINDTHGHSAGDELIRQVGSRLAQTARRADSPGSPGRRRIRGRGAPHRRGGGAAPGRTTGGDRRQAVRSRGRRGPRDGEHRRGGVPARRLAQRRADQECRRGDVSRETRDPAVGRVPSSVAIEGAQSRVLGPRAQRRQPC